MVFIPTSNSKLSATDALEMCECLCTLCYEFTQQSDLPNLHKALHQLLSLYFDCRASRPALSAILQELEFPQFASKTLKQLSNSGVFRTDDIWFSSFYLYNICWHFSSACPQLASKLHEARLHLLLISNINHGPYRVNMERRNVNFLLKASLSIMHNMVRRAGCRAEFCVPRVVQPLQELCSGKGGEDSVVSVLAVLCLGFICCAESAGSMGVDVGHCMKEVVRCLRRLLETPGGKYRGFSLGELVEVLRAASACGAQMAVLHREGAVQLLVDCLVRGGGKERDRAGLLWSLGNLVSGAGESGTAGAEAKVREVASYYKDSDTSAQVQSVAGRVLWRLGEARGPYKQLQTAHTIFINYAEGDSEAARVIRDRLCVLGCYGIVEAGESQEECGSGTRLTEWYDSASVVVVCVSEYFKSAENFMMGAEYCVRQRKKVLPVLVAGEYVAEGWLRVFLEQSCGGLCYGLGGGDWDRFLGALEDAFKEPAAAAAEEEMDASSEERVSDVAFTGVSQAVTAAPVAGGLPKWLREHRLERLQSKFSSIDVDMLKALKTMRAEAPEYYFSALERHLGLSFVDILQFNSALDSSVLPK